MGPIQTLDDALDMLRRRAWIIIGVIVIGCAISLAVALTRPRAYTSTEVLQISRAMLSDTAARAAGQPASTARRLQLIEQRLMTRDSLLEVIYSLDLYTELPLTQNEKVDLLRRSVGVDFIAAARSGYSDDGAISIMSVTATMGTAELAQKVAHELARRTIALSTGTRLSEARDTLEFFAEREQHLREQLISLEDDIVEFHTRNDISLPGSVESRRDEIDAINSSLLELNRELIVTRRQAEREIRDAREATARRLRRDFDDQIAVLEDQRNLLQQRRSELLQSIETTPEIQRELNVLVRRRDDVQSQLDTVSGRKADAEIILQLETENQTERLSVIEPASLPDYPSGGGRKKLAMMGGMMSVGMAFLIAFLLELRRPVVRSAAQMERETGLEPVIAIPFIK